jgi:DNA-binding PadR family transcriptional regulator
MSGKKKTIPTPSQIGKKAAERMFSLFLLWFISKKPSHGYELINKMKEDKEFEKVGSAHVYPFLRKLSNMGLIKAKEESTGKRIRKLYTITPTGKKKLKQLKDLLFGDSIRGRFLREMIK